MPNIKPISDLRNYTEVLHDVAVGAPVFLTKNGRGRYAIVDMQDYERTQATLRLMNELAKCSRGTPRVANRFLKRVRDFATVLGDGVIDRDVSLMSLKRMDVDALGLDELDRSLLRAIIEMYNGGPVGLETLAAALGEEAVTLEDLCEPYLMQMGFLTRTPRGRCATRLAYEHLGLKAPESASPLIVTHSSLPITL